MKYYLSSYKIGNQSDKLKALVPKNAKVAYISNAFDAETILESRQRHEIEDIEELSNLGFEVDHINLREYFGKQNELKKKIKSYNLIWVSGGNVKKLRNIMCN